MKGNQRVQRRRRGIILSDRGWEKLQAAIEAAREKENRGHRFTLERLAEKTGLGVDTLMKVAARELKVDKQTLKQYFQAFGLTLELADFYSPDAEEEAIGDSLETLELPEGQVPLDSPFYLQRGSIERDGYRAIERAGALIRIKGPKRAGKTSLVSRILDRASRLDYHTVYLSVQLADKELFEALDRFLRWFCANITRSLGLENCIDEYWDDLFASKMSCKIYFEQFILKSIDRPIVIALDDIDRLFQHPELADEFFSLLRSWHEEGKNKALWGKLRLIVAHSHSTEVYTPLNINQSPFNVGFPVELPPFTPEDVETLARRYRVDGSGLFDLVGGNPYLIRLGLYHIARGERSIGEILSTPVTDDTNIYKDHLQRQLWNLQHTSDGLRAALARVVMADGAIEIDLIQAFQLQSLGFIHFRGNLCAPSCQLYARYFREYFTKSESATAVRSGFSPTRGGTAEDSLGENAPKKVAFARYKLQRSRHAG